MKLSERLKRLEGIPAPPRRSKRLSRYRIVHTVAPPGVPSSIKVTRCAG